MPTRVSAMLVRGADAYGPFDEERRPLFETRPEGAGSFTQTLCATFRQMNAEVARACVACQIRDTRCILRGFMILELHRAE